jgi:hypothetical protein
MLVAMRKLLILGTAMFLVGCGGGGADSAALNG